MGFLCVLTVQVTSLFGGPPLPTIVQSGMTTSSAAGITTVNINPVDTSKSFLIFQTRHNSNHPTGGMLRGRLASSTTIEFERAAVDSSVITIQWYLVEYQSGVLVQRGEVAQTTTAVTIPIAPVAATDRVFVLWSKTPGTSIPIFQSRHPVYIDVEPTLDELTLYSEEAAAGNFIAWQLVEFLDPTNVHVQRGTTSFATIDTFVDVTLSSAVDLGRSFALVGHTADDATPDLGAMLVTAELINATTLRIERANSGLLLPAVGWQVVELLDGSSVQNGVESFLASDLQRSVALSPVDNARTVPFASGQPVSGQNIGRTTETEDIVGAASFTMGVAGTTLTIDRDYNLATAAVPWYVVEWGIDGALPLITSISPDNGSPLGGEVITLTGYFTGTETVDLGGAAATSLNFVDANTLTALTPAHVAGTVDVTVSNVDGSDVLVGAFTYNPPPSLTSVAPSSGTPFGGDAVTLDGANFSLSTTIDFDGIPATSTRTP